MIQNAWAGGIEYSGSQVLKLDSKVKIIQKLNTYKSHSFFGFLTISLAANFQKGLHGRVAEGYVALIILQNCFISLKRAINLVFREKKDFAMR